MTVARAPRREPLAATIAVVPAAGRGLRMGGSVPKQFLAIGGLPLVVHSLRVLQAAPSIDAIVLAVPQSDIDYCQADIVKAYDFNKVTKVVGGGEERQDSVRLALAAVGTDAEIVLVHDAVRPFLTVRNGRRRGEGSTGDWCRHHCPSHAGYGETRESRPRDRANGGPETPLVGTDPTGVSEGLAAGGSSQGTG